jgi:RND family efflux transporter MFP subunit
MKPMLTIDGYAWLSMGICVLVPVAGCSKATSEQLLPTFEVESPRTAPGYVERQFVGEVRAAQHVEIRARVKGIIESVGVDEGRHVKAGQLLFAIDSRSYQKDFLKAQAATKSAAAELKAAQLEQQNTAVLQQKNVVSDAEVATLTAKTNALNAKYEEARANEEQAALHLSFAQVRAPFDGVVNRIAKKVGSLANEDDLLTTVSNTGDVFVYFNVSEQESLRLGAMSDSGPLEASLRTVDGELFKNRGVVDAIGSEVSKNSGTVAFRSKFKNDGGRLRHGSVGKIELRVPTPSALLIPLKATFEVQDHVYVYIVDRESRVRMKRIVPSARLDDFYMIESGLASTDKFIVEGIQKAKEGEKIVAKLNSPTSGTLQTEGAK